MIFSLGRRGRAALTVICVAVLSRVAGAETPAAAPPAETTVAMLRAAAAKGSSGIPALTAALHDSRAPIRAAAVQLLAGVQKRGAIPSIAPMISDPDDGVAVAVAGALVSLGGEGTLEPVRRALASPSARVRTQTAAYIGDKRDVRFIKDLGALLSDETPGVRRTALEALRATGDPATFPLLMAATGDREASTAASAIAGLEILKDPRALPRLEQLAASDQGAVREAVAHALPVLGGAQGEGSAFARLLHDKDRGVRLAAARGLRDAPSPTGSAALRVLGADPDSAVRRVAIAAWGAASGPDADAALASMTSDADENVRASAVLSLGSRHAVSAADRVAALAGDPSERVREAVASSLGDLGRAHDLAPLETLAKDSVAAVRASAVVAAARIGGADAYAIVDRSLADGDALVRLEAVRALGMLEGSKPLERLRGLAATGEIPGRIAAIDQLAARKDRGAIPLLKKIAQEPVETVRTAARRALEAIGS